MLSQNCFDQRKSSCPTLSFRFYDVTTNQEINSEHFAKQQLNKIDSCNLSQREILTAKTTEIYDNLIATVCCLSLFSGRADSSTECELISMRRRRLKPLPKMNWPGDEAYFRCRHKRFMCSRGPSRTFGARVLSIGLKWPLLESFLCSAIQGPFRHLSEVKP